MKFTEISKSHWLHKIPDQISCINKKHSWIQVWFHTSLAINKRDCSSLQRFDMVWRYDGHPTCKKMLGVGLLVVMI